MNYKKMEGHKSWKFKFYKCKIKAYLIAVGGFLLVFQDQLVGMHKPARVCLCTLERNGVN